MDVTYDATNAVVAWPCPIIDWLVVALETAGLAARADPHADGRALFFAGPPELMLGAFDVILEVRDRFGVQFIFDGHGRQFSARTGRVGNVLSEGELGRVEVCRAAAHIDVSELASLVWGGLVGVAVQPTPTARVKRARKRVK